MGIRGNCTLVAEFSICAAYSLVLTSCLPVSRGFLTSCEAELHELMKQIDIMVAHKKSEWEGQTQALEACLEVRDQELSSTRVLLNEKHKEVLSQIYSVLYPGGLFFHLET